MEVEDAYGTDIPAPLDHRDIIATFRHIQRHPAVDPRRVAFFGVSHGGELQMKVISDLGGAPSTALGAGPAALVPAEPAVRVPGAPLRWAAHGGGPAMQRLAD